MRNIIHSLLLFFMTLVFDACINRLDFEPDSSYDGEFIVDGFISDQEGPYTIRLYLPTSAEANVLFPKPVIAKEVSISDDTGETETLTSIGAGVYQTGVTGIRGQVGRKYTLRIELLDGDIFESIPDEMRPVGEIEDVNFNFESFKPKDGPTKYGFRVFMDSKNDSGSVRWKFTGTYVVETYPQYRLNPRVCRMGIPDPPACSGYVWVDNRLTRVGDCTCCICWVSDLEPKPKLSEEIVSTDGVYKKIEVGYVPFDVWRFHYRKYMIKVEQMSLSDGAYDFWKVIKDQKEGSTSLFQPSMGQVKTNFVSQNSNRKVKGFFYASAVKKKIVFITGDDASIPVPDFDVPRDEQCPHFWNECDVAWLNASRTPPPEWE